MVILKDIRLIEFGEFYKQEEFLRDRGTDTFGEIIPNLITQLRKQSDRGIVGELERTYTSPITTLVNASHMVKNIILDNDGIYGDVHILDTPYGNILESVLSDNISFIPDVTYSNDDGTISIERIYTFTATINND